MIDLTKDEKAAEFKREFIEWHLSAYGKAVDCEVREWRPGAYMAYNVRGL